MELKPTSTEVTCQLDLLLIVPYGIETLQDVRFYLFQKLLIVPYGIETYHQLLLHHDNQLLIVPYGIETIWYTRFSCYRRTFNRTLWN